MAIIKAYASYGVTGKEKRTIYTVGTPASDIYDEILIDVPGEVHENDMGQLLYEGYDDTTYLLNEILTDIGDGEPALRWVTFKGWATRKCKVIEPTMAAYSGGESRSNPGEAVDYMMADINGIELYAEAEASDEDASYDELKAAILEQAQANGINPLVLKFWYDD